MNPPAVYLSDNLKEKKINLFISLVMNESFKKDSNSNRNVYL